METRAPRRVFLATSVERRDGLVFASVALPEHVGLDREAARSVIGEWLDPSAPDLTVEFSRDGETLLVVALDGSVTDQQAELAVRSLFQLLRDSGAFAAVVRESLLMRKH